ncbi:GH25 family lysozyme [Neobacillus sp. OS1-2]|uniref:GH25 family lysozyme n=1 Tax=Neobacillus sp. OS1-2 TaxID=3070680 RepID=UPI0027E18B1B|nr:GH25 family lysozyme [Neobacillus sp. OS1-2]WML38715.1 GH25 family lysozyme [Neobacillus sp. OS1-2]
MAQLKGIDVSKHQGVIDWDKVKAVGIQFAMLRLGIGSDMASQDDAQFERNVRECERVGIQWGAYLYSYALNVDQAKSEAAHALRLLKGKNPTYPIAFDMEDADGYKAKNGMPCNAELVAICNTFLSIVEGAGYYVSLYASLSWLNNQLNDNSLDRFDKWVAQWGPSCSYGNPFGMWQYTSDGTVNGISGRVDMNYSYHDFGADNQPVSKSAPVVSAAPVKPAPQTVQSQSIVPFPGHLIKVGTKGKDVERIQRAVKVNPDGIYGPKTKAAVKAYQSRHGLAADGIVGPATWSVMF